MTSWALGSGRGSGPGPGLACPPQVWDTEAGIGEGTSSLLLGGCPGKYSFLFPTSLGVPGVGTDGWKSRMGFTFCACISAPWQMGRNHPQHF